MSWYIPRNDIWGISHTFSRNKSSSRARAPADVLLRTRVCIYYGV